MDSGAYASAGVDIDAKQRAIAAMRAKIRATHNDAVLTDIGHFGGLFALPGAGDTVLVASIDGIGTKLKLAIARGTPAAHAGIGRDIVHHSVNDILCCGARPAFFLDYLALGVSDTDLITAVIGGVADSCAAHGMALLGGETAELPGIYTPGDYDLAGAIVGTVRRDRILDGRSVAAGDLLIGFPSAGLHTNGYSLARRAFGLDGPAEQVRERLEEANSGIDGTLGDALLAEHRSYFAAVAPALERGAIKALAHITGGGFLDNVPRILPAAVAAGFDPETWAVPSLFTAIQEAAHVASAEMYRVFNMGIGMVAVVAPESAVTVRSLIPDARVIGEVTPRGDGPAIRILGVTG